MTQELERKFTVSKKVIKKYKFQLKYKIEQGYLLINNNREVRVRSKNNMDNDKNKKYYLQRKVRKNNNNAEETSIKLSKNSGEKIIEEVRPTIYKNRYELENPKELLELDEIKEVIIDVYIRPTVSYNKIELEFTSEKAMKEFIPPMWFGEELEFSDSDLWLNMKENRLELPNKV